MEAPSNLGSIMNSGSIIVFLTLLINSWSSSRLLILSRLYILLPCVYFLKLLEMNPPTF